MRPPAASASAHGDHLLAAAASSASAACTHECQAVSQPVGEAHWPGMAPPTSDRVGALFSRSHGRGGGGGGGGGGPSLQRVA